MSPEISIRVATTADIPLIESLALHIWPQTYNDILNPEQLAYMLDYIYSPASLQRQFDEQITFLVVALNNQPIGFASYSLVEEPGIYKLHKIYMDPAIQGKGLGKATIGYIAGQIAAEGARILRLNVNRYNKARFFYEKLGFVITKEEDVDIGNGYFMNDYVMEMHLSG